MPPPLFCRSRSLLLSVDLLEVLGVLGHEARPLAGDIRVGEDRLNRALGLAGSAIDALVRVDVVLILTLVNAVDGAHFDAARILCVDAGLNDDVGHGSCTSG